MLISNDSKIDVRVNPRSKQVLDSAQCGVILCTWPVGRRSRTSLMHRPVANKIRAKIPQNKSDTLSFSSKICHESLRRDDMIAKTGLNVMINCVTAKLIYEIANINNSQSYDTQATEKIADRLNPRLSVKSKP